MEGIDELDIKYDFLGLYEEVKEVTGVEIKKKVRNN